MRKLEKTDLGLILEKCAKAAEQAASDPLIPGDQYGKGWKHAARRIANDIRAMKEGEDG